MILRLLLLTTLMFSCPTLYSQVGIGTSAPDPSSILDISATNKGLLIPRVSLSSISNSTIDGKYTNATGLLIYNTNAALPGGTGFYYWDGSAWDTMKASTQSNATTGNWSTSGNVIDDQIFLGTTNDKALNFRVNNISVGGFKTNNTFNLGVGSSSNGARSMALGFESTAGGDEATALGRQAAATGHRSVAAGFESKAQSEESAAYGRNALASAPRTLAAGFESSATAEDATALGRNADANKARTTATGFNSIAGSDEASAYGSNAHAVGLRSTALGYRTVASNNDAIAIGSESKAEAIASVVVGNRSISNGLKGIAIGYSAEAVANFTTAIGDDSYTNRDFGTAIGSQANAKGDASTALGYKSLTLERNAVALGAVSDAQGENSMALGHDTYTNKINAIAIGNNSESTGSDAVALGASSRSREAGSIAIGKSTNASAINSLAIGNGAQATGQNSAAIGNGTTASQANTLILGNNVNVGIGTNAPTAKLHVDGSLRIVDGNQGDSKVLTSDAAGNATWAAIDSGKSYGEIYGTNNFSPILGGNYLITGLTNDPATLKNVTAGDSYIEVKKTGVYKISYALSIWSSDESDRNFLLFVAKGTASAGPNIVNKSRSYVGNSDSNTYINASKVLLLNMVAGERLYLGYATNGHGTTFIGNSISLTVESMNF
ncbi:hypothetical protein [Flavimarina sp. Hel_I_48]|uniref:hypothetical protein n=1 Tax=Flavimarina sp. Hel_I_48 TaxID=1392488 RepID=UPI0004DED1C3|nr:hypothetical protein [Flavimarina sp. Hel_I_48]